MNDEEEGEGPQLTRLERKGGKRRGRRPPRRPPWGPRRPLEASRRAKHVHRPRSPYLQRFENIKSEVFRPSRPLGAAFGPPGHKQKRLGMNNSVSGKGSGGPGIRVSKMPSRRRPLDPSAPSPHPSHPPNGNWSPFPRSSSSILLHRFSLQITLPCRTHGLVARAGRAFRPRLLHRLCSRSRTCPTVARTEGSSS